MGGDRVSRGLLTADIARKNVEAMALRLLGVGPRAEQQVRALQQFIEEGRWNDDARLSEHQRLVNETLGEEDGVLIVDGSDFPKHGDHSAGVAPGSGSLEQDSPLGIVAMKKEKQAGFMHDLGLGKG